MALMAKLRHDEKLIIVVGVRPEQYEWNRKLTGPVCAGRYLKDDIDQAQVKAILLHADELFDGTTNDR